MRCAPPAPAPTLSRRGPLPGGPLPDGLLSRGLLGLGLGLCSLGLRPSWAQAVPIPAPLPPPPTSACISRYGETGCGARLYAQLLCDHQARPLPLPTLQQQLQQGFEQAGLRFAGVSPEQVEGAAVRYYAPQLCPAQAGALRELFFPSGRTAPGAP